MVAPEVFHAETDTAELNGVELLNLVVVLAVFVLQRPGNQPQSVDGLLLDRGVGNSVVQVVAFSFLASIRLGVFFKQGEAPCFGLLGPIDHLVELGEIDLVLVADDLTLRLGLERHLYDVAGLVVE